MNLLVCTPGRLLQHFDETVGFDASNLQVLVIDEADRILDLGFETSLSAIVSGMPTQHNPSPNPCPHPYPHRPQLPAP